MNELSLTRDEERKYLLQVAFEELPIPDERIGILAFLESSRCFSRGVRFDRHSASTLYCKQGLWLIRFLGVRLGANLEYANIETSGYGKICKTCDLQQMFEALKLSL